MRGPCGRAQWPSPAAWKMAKFAMAFNTFASVKACGRRKRLQISQKMKCLGVGSAMHAYPSMHQRTVPVAVLLGLKECCGEVDRQAAVGLLVSVVVVVVHRGIRWSVMSRDSLHVVVRS